MDLGTRKAELLDIIQAEHAAWQAVLRESEAAWQQMADLVRALPAADLLEPHRFAWLGGAPLGPAVLDGSLAHLHEHIHLLALQAWRALPRQAE